jgi:hypothetical protein
VKKKSNQGTDRVTIEILSVSAEQI